MVLQFFLACNMNPLLNFLERKRTGLRAGSCKYTSKYKLKLKKNCTVKFGLICQASPFIPLHFTFVLFLLQNVSFQYIPNSKYSCIHFISQFSKLLAQWANFDVGCCLFTGVFISFFLPFPGPSYMHFEHKDSLIVLKLFIWGAKHLIRQCAIFGAFKETKPKEVYDHTQFPKLGTFKSISLQGGEGWLFPQYPYP